MKPQSPNKEKILYISFSYNSQFLSVGTESGFKIFSCTPLRLELDRNMGGGIGLVEMLEVTNIMILAGGGASPKYAPNKLFIWDDSKESEIKEFRFGTNIRGAKLFRHFLIAICDSEITIFNENYDKLTTERTLPNSRGVYSVTRDPQHPKLAFPDFSLGSLHIYELHENDTNIKKTYIKDAHKSQIARMEFNYSGTMIATASEKGTLIRVFDTESGKQLYEFRRGKDPATVYSIAFDAEGKHMAVASDRGTTHVYQVEGADEEKKKNKKNKGSSLFGGIGGLVGLGNYFDSQWSFVSVKNKTGVETHVAFPQERVMVMVNMLGEFVAGKIEGSADSGNGSFVKEANTSLLLET